MPDKHPRHVAGHERRIRRGQRRRIRLDGLQQVGKEDLLVKVADGLLSARTVVNRGMISAALPSPLPSLT